MRKLNLFRAAPVLFGLLYSIITIAAQPFVGSNTPGGVSDFSFTIEAGTTNLSLILPGNATAYSDLLLKKGSLATDSSYDFISSFKGQTNSIHLEFPELAPGTYFLRVRTPATSQAHTFSVIAETNVAEMRSTNRPVSKPVGARLSSSIPFNSRQYFRFDIATNTELRVALTSSSLSPDLYLQKSQLPTDAQFFKRSQNVTNDTVVLLSAEGTPGTYFVSVVCPPSSPANVPYTLRIDANPIQPLSWDPGATPEGTLISSNFTATATDYYFKISTANPSLGAWRTALNVIDGEAHLYLSRGVLPTPTQSDFKSEKAGSDGFVLSSSQFSPNEVWYILVRANPNTHWSLVSGAPYVQDLGAISADGSSGSGQFIMGPEGMRFFSAQVPSDMLAWRLWLNGGTNNLLLKKTSLPLPQGNELSQNGQALVVPPYLTGGQQYFIAVTGSPGSTNQLDSRQQAIVDLGYGQSASNLVVTGFPYTTYRVQVPAQQIAWQISIPSTNGNPNVSVRRNFVPNENYNDALSESTTAITDNITLVPPILSDGTFYITVWSSGPHQFTIQNGPPAVTDINYVDTVKNDDPDRVGWRFYRVTDINQQLGTLGWELSVTNANPGARIAIRRNAAPSTWTFRNPTQNAANYYDLISPGQILQQPGHQADVWYIGVYNPSNSLGGFTLTTREIQVQPISDNASVLRTNNPPGLWQFFSIDVPDSNAGSPLLGWDLRLQNVTNTPTLVVRRDALPDSLTTTFALPVNATNWPSRSQWAAGADWTGRPFPNSGTTNENGRILEMAFGRPLEAGRYYIGVQTPVAASQPASFTVLSRWIGTNQVIPIRTISWSGERVTNSVAPRSVDYYAVQVSENHRSFKVHLKLLSGEAMLISGKDTLPNISANSANSLIGTSGKTIQKLDQEFFTILPPRGTNVVQPGTYYFGVVGEGQSPADATHIGSGAATYVLETLGEMPEQFIGTLGTTNITVGGSLSGGDSIAYHFRPEPSILGFWISLQDISGNPVAVSRATVELADPGLSSSGFPYDPYGNDAGQNSGAIAGTFITVADPGTTETIMLKARPSSGTFSDASYTLHVDAIRPDPLNFDGGSTTITAQDPDHGAYFYVDVPPGALGWDLRLTNVISGSPQIMVSRDFLPLANSTPIQPNTQTNWPSGSRWTVGVDWTERAQSVDGINETGRILAMGMGRPLEPGRYYISVQGANTELMSYTLVSRGIGNGLSIPVTPLDFNGGSMQVSGLPAREAAYYSVDVPAGAPSWKVRLQLSNGEGLLLAAKGALPNVATTTGGSLASTSGRKMQKVGDEYFLLLPTTGLSNVVTTTYYLAVVGEGFLPQPGKVGAGTSDFTITSIGAAPVRDLGQLGLTDLLETNALAAGDTQIYQFSVPSGTLGMEARLENRTGNPVMALRQGPLVPFPGASSSGIGTDPYGNDNGELNNVFVSQTLINIGSPSNTVYTLVVKARSTSSTVFTNATYTLRLNASGSTTIGFDGESYAITNQAAQSWKYFRVIVPTNALGWDLRLINVTNGTPRLVIKREGLPSTIQTGPWSQPGTATLWPTNAQWAPGQDWTRRSQSAADSTINEDGRVFACGMGRPLAPGTYFVGVFNNSPSVPTSYTVLSRGIGPEFTIPVTELPFSGTFSGTLPAREAAYFSVVIPTNTLSWKVKLTGDAGESMLVALRGAIPNTDLNTASGTLANGKGMQKPGNEHFVLLPVNGQTNITAGTNYFAVVSEGVNPPSSSRIGSGSSSFTFESVGMLPPNGLGLLTSDDIIASDTVEGGEVKLYQFVIPSGMLGFKVRLESRVGNPAFILRQGDKTPDPGAAIPSADNYGNEGGYSSTDGNTTLFTVPNPLPGPYTLVVKGRALNGNYPDASYTLHLKEMLVPEHNFTPELNTNGLSNAASDVLDDNERIFYKFTIPATNFGQPVVGWKLNLAQSSGLASMRVRKDLLPTDAASSSEMPFATAQAIIVPPFLTNGDWYVEVKGSGSTAFSLSSTPLLLERPAWIMPAPGETNQALGVTAPLFGDSGIDTNGIPLPADQSTFLEQGSLHYYAVSIPATNSGVLRAALEAISGNPDLYLRYGAPPTLYHNAAGASGTIYDRSMLANATEYANWVPIDGKLETKLKPGLWYMAVRAAGNANARYRLKLSVGSITDLTLDGTDLSNQLVAGGDWRYYRFTAPETLPGGISFKFSKQSGDVIVQVRDTVPPGNGATGSNSDLKDWTSDAKNNGPYGSFDLAGSYPLNAAPLRPGAVYYLGVRALRDSSFTISASTNSAPNARPATIDFYGGTGMTNLPPGEMAIYRIDVPPEATRWKHTGTHAIGVQLYIEQGTIPARGTTDDWRNSPATANSSLNQYLLGSWPWVPGQAYFLVITNATAQPQDIVFAMDGRNAETDDNDNDGLPDAWELEFFGNLNSQNAAGDPDRDLVNNFDELGDLTNPNDGTSFNPRLITASANGTILRGPDAPSYTLNSKVTLTAIPDPGYAFVKWSGDALGRDNPIQITMDAHKTIGASFKIAGDDLVTALPLSGLEVSTVASNVGMTKESGEPNHAGNPGGKSIWWNWTAPADGNATITTAGSAFNTLLAVYTGDSVSALTTIASDNNSGGLTNRSIVHFTASAGTVYHIAVDGFNGASSRINLALTLDAVSSTPPDLHGVARLKDGTASFSLQGAPNRTYSFEATTDFKTWIPVGSITTDSTGAGDFSDASAKDLKKRFYRIAQ